ncbi:MAG: glycosyltransferase [Candidatus Hydrogenedentes bacterium]|nr:glycosyltransferase [Candidatus Hydrogenedentota bacterium]
MADSRAQERPRLAVTKRFRKLLAYDKFADPVPRILIPKSSYWLDDAWRRAAGSLNWQVQSVPVVMEGVLSRDMIANFLETLATFRPDFILTVNLSGMDDHGLFARLFEDIRIPYVTWFVDNPRTILGGRTGCASLFTVALTWDRSYRDFLVQAGFPVVEHLPLAVDPTLFNREPADTWERPGGFVGNSGIAPAEREWLWVNEHPPLADAIRAVLDCGVVTRENFAAGLEALLSADLLATLDRDEKRHAEYLLFLEGSRRLRHTTLRVAHPEGVEIRGDPEWRRDFPAAGGLVNYEKELPRYYRETEVNLNVTSVQMPATANQRVFDCPATGGFLLTDAQAELQELFDAEKEVARYHSLDECRELFRSYRTNPRARRELTTRARKRILGEHTYAHRLQRMVSLLKPRFS